MNTECQFACAQTDKIWYIHFIGFFWDEVLPDENDGTETRTLTLRNIMLIQFFFFFALHGFYGH